ncbi:MAG: hypothetical protein JSR58_07950 [Verrucomicrobia bacterium]|nr:hypothetical protein [Verrucomicrobiota bacterium]
MFKRLFLIGSISYLVHTYTEGFTTTRLASQENYGFSDFGARIDAEKILDQPFHYLASGGQSFVFISEDGKYVLKFLKGHARPWTVLPKVRARKIKKIAKTLEGYRLLEEKLPSHSATIYAHFSKTPFRAAHLIDKCGIHHTVDLSSAECILQHHVKPLNSLSTEKVHELASLLAEEKMTDTDPRQHKNWGMLGDTVVIFDAGRIATDPQGKFALSDKYISWEQSLEDS